LTFDVGEHHAEFGMSKDQNSSPFSFAYYGCDVVVSDEFVKSFDVCPNVPHLLDCESTKG